MLFNWYNMNGLVPKEQKLYLPYSKRIVTMVYFDARQVFASLLSCCSLNKDEHFLFHEQGDPQAKYTVQCATGRCLTVSDCLTGIICPMVHTVLDIV